MENKIYIIGIGPGSSEYLTHIGTQTGPFAYLCSRTRRFGAHLGTQWEGPTLRRLFGPSAGWKMRVESNGPGFGCQGLRNPVIIEKRAQSRPMVYSTFVLCLGLGTSGCSAVW